MKDTIIPLDSYTTAKKASRYLASRGIRAKTVKTGTGMFGCTFGISVSEPPDYICGILSEVRIRCGRAVPVPPPPPPGPPRPPKPPRPPRR